MSPVGFVRTMSSAVLSGVPASASIPVILRDSSPVFCTTASKSMRARGSTRIEQVWLASSAATCARSEAPLAVVANAKIVAPTTIADASAACGASFFSLEAFG